MSTMTEIQYAATRELQRFIEQTRIRLTSNPWNCLTLYEFDSHNRLEAGDPVHGVGAKILQFISNSISYIVANEKDLDFVADTDPVIRHRRLDRLLMAVELEDRYTQLFASSEFAPQSRKDWEDDVSNILAFLESAGNRRYEHAHPQMTVAYFPLANSSVDYGPFGRSLLDDYKAILRLSRDARTLIVIHRGCVVTDIEDAADQSMPPPAASMIPVPPRLAHVRDFTRPDRHRLPPIIFNLNPNGTIEVLAAGELVFRMVNNVWRILDLRAVQQEVLEEVSKCSRNGARIAYNVLTLAMDLADKGEGALLFLCEEPTTDVIKELVLPMDGIIRSIPGWRHEELNARNRFTRLIGTKNLSLNGSYADLPRILRDVCSIDGASMFSYSGTLLGFGCIVKLANFRSDATRPAEGARSNAAKQISERGLAIKVSSDGDATLFLQGKKRGTFF